MPGRNPCVASSPPIRNRASRRRHPPTPTPGSRRASRHRATFSYSQRHTGHRERARACRGFPGCRKAGSSLRPGHRDTGSDTPRNRQSPHTACRRPCPVRGERIGFPHPIPETVHENKQSGRRTQSAPILKRLNPAVPETRQASRQTGHSPEAGPNPISTANLRTSPRQRRLRQTIAARTQPETAEYRGSLMMTGRSHSRAHTDSSAPLGPNPISGSDSRISPPKQAIRQTDTIRIHPGTAESQCFRDPVNQEHSRLRSHARIESDFGVRFPNQPHRTHPGTNHQPQNRTPQHI